MVLQLVQSGSLDYLATSRCRAVSFTMKLEHIRPAIWDPIIEHMTYALSELEFEGDDIAIDWRIGANARKLDRELYQKYGFFKDIILHERFQNLKTFLQENVVISFDVLLGDPVMPLVTSLAVLYMSYKRVSDDLLALMAAFLFNVNPLYIVLTFVVYHVLLRWKKHDQPKQYRERKVDRNSSSNSSNGNGYSAMSGFLRSGGSSNNSSSSSSNRGNSTRSSSSSSTTTSSSSSNSSSSNRATSSVGEDEGSWDHVLLGSDIGTLYTAALLSRVGHRCCVLQPDGAQPLHVKAVDSEAGLALPPMPIRNMCIGKVNRYQSLFDMLLTTQKGGRIDSDERVAFAPLGTADDGFATVVLKMSKKIRNARKDLWMLRAGEASLAVDASSKLLVDRTRLEHFTGAVCRSQDHLVQFLNTRAVLPHQGQELAQGENAKQIYNIATNSAEYIFKAIKMEVPAGQAGKAGQEGQVGPPADGAGQEDNSDALDSLCMLLERVAVVGSDELTMKAAECSGLGLAQALVVCADGAFYPVGGPQRLADYLRRIINNAGGQVRSSVPAAKIDMEDCDGVLHATGVVLQDGSKVSVLAGGSVISGVGLLSTYEDYVTAEDVARMAAQPGAEAGGPLKGIESLVEASPRVLVLFWLSGSGSDSGLQSSDFIDFGGSVTGAVSRVWSPSAKDPSWANRFVHIGCLGAVLEDLRLIFSHSSLNFAIIFSPKL